MPDQETGMMARMRQRGKQFIGDALVTGDAVLVGVKQAGVKVIGGVKQTGDIVVDGVKERGGKVFEGVKERGGKVLDQIVTVKD